MTLGTDWYQINSSGMGIQHDSPYRLSIRHHRMIPHNKATLGQSPDRRKMAAIAGDVVNVNLEEAVD